VRAAVAAAAHAAKPKFLSLIRNEKDENDAQTNAAVPSHTASVSVVVNVVEQCAGNCSGCLGRGDSYSTETGRKSSGCIDFDDRAEWRHD
jgi:hypothetical protein